MKRALAFTLMVLAIMIIAVSCEEPQAHEHTYATEWSHDDTFHWHASTCGHEDVVSDKEEHKWKGGDEDGWVVDVDSTEKEEGKKHRECSVCGYKEEGKVPLQGHVHTFSAYGNNADKHWRTCTTCNEKFTYSHSLTYKYNTEKHHQECYCGYSTTEVAHTFETLASDGSTLKACTVCPYQETLTKQKETTTTVSKIVADAGGVEKTTAADEKGNTIPVQIPKGTVTIAADVIATESTPTTDEGETIATKVSFPVGALKIKEGAEKVKLTVIAAPVTVASLNGSGYQITAGGKEATSEDANTSNAVVAGFEFKLEGAVATDLKGTADDSEKTGQKVGTEITTYIAPGLGDKSNLSIQCVGDGTTDKNTYTPSIKSYRNSDGELKFIVYHFSKYIILSTDKKMMDDQGNMYTEFADETLTKNLQEGSKLTLLADVTLSNTVSFDKTVTLDLNGKILNCGESDKGKRTTMTAIEIKSGKTLTLKNGSISYFGNNTEKNACYIIKNAGTLITEKLKIQANILASCSVSMSEINKAISDSNSCPDVVLVLNKGKLEDTSSTLEMTVSLENKKSIDYDKKTFAGVKPLIIFMQAGSSATLVNSTLTGTTDAPGGILGLYALVGSDASAGITADITGSKISLTNNSFGWTRPVFADGRNATKKIEITIGNSEVTSKDALEETIIDAALTNSGVTDENNKTEIKNKIKAGYNRAYGLRATGNSEIKADATTLRSTSVAVEDNGATEIKLAGELNDYVTYSESWKYCGKIINSTTNEEVGVMTAKDKDSLEKNIKYANEEAEIQLLNDIELTGGKDHYFDIDKDLTIDLEGHTLSSKDYRIFVIEKGTLTLENGTVKGDIGKTGDSGGKVGSNVGSSLIKVTSTEGNAGVIVRKGAKIEAESSYGITALHGESDTNNYTATIDIYGEITSKNPCVAGNGSKYLEGFKVYINIYDGAVLTKKAVDKTWNQGNIDKTAIYQPNYGVLKIYGGTITSNDGTAVEVRAGTVTITGGDLKSEATGVKCDTNGNGTTTEGSALAVAQHVTGWEINVTVSGGRFEGYHALSVMNPEKKNVNADKNAYKKVKVTVAGGSFVATGNNGEAKIVNTDEYYTVSGSAVYTGTANFTVSANLNQTTE